MFTIQYSVFVLWRHFSNRMPTHGNPKNHQVKVVFPLRSPDNPTLIQFHEKNRDENLSVYSLRHIWWWNKNTVDNFLVKVFEIFLFFINFGTLIPPKICFLMQKSLDMVRFCSLIFFFFVYFIRSSGNQGSPQRLFPPANRNHGLKEVKLSIPQIFGTLSRCLLECGSWG